MGRLDPYFANRSIQPKHGGAVLAARPGYAKPIARISLQGLLDYLPGYVDLPVEIQKTSFMFYYHFEKIFPACYHNDRIVIQLIGAPIG
jgi:hypothetical protein